MNPEDDFKKLVFRICTSILPFHNSLITSLSIYLYNSFNNRNKKKKKKNKKDESPDFSIDDLVLAAVRRYCYLAS